MQSTITGYMTKAVVSGIPYTVYTKEGFRGLNIPCLVWYADGWHVSVQGREVPVRMVICNLNGVAAKDNLAYKTDTVLGTSHSYSKANYSDWRNL